MIYNVLRTMNMIVDDSSISIMTMIVGTSTSTGTSSSTNCISILVLCYDITILHASRSEY